MVFCTSIHCMDGRIQEPIINYLKAHYNTDYVDIVTEPGPCKLLAENINTTVIHSIIERTNISLNKHKSTLIAVSGHHDCAGNPCDKETQIQHIHKSMNYLERIFPEIKIIGLWIDSNWEIHDVS